VFLGVNQEAWMLTLMVDCPISCCRCFCGLLDVQMPKPKGQTASMMKKEKCEAL